MDNDIISTNLLKVFCSFVKELTTCFPEYESVIYENYNSIIDSTDFSLKDNELMKEFMDRINKCSKQIKSKDDDIFIKDEIILTGISFKSIWDSKINEKTKDSIWKYLQTFSLLNVSYRANDELKDALDSLSTGDEELNTKDKTLIKDLKDIKELTEEIQTENIHNESQKTPSKPDKDPESEGPESTETNPLEDMIKNSEIGRIAEEVSSQINMDEMLGDLTDDSDMGEVFSKLVTGGGIGKIFDGINKVVTEKVESEEFSKDDLQKEAMDMCENMGQNLFSQMGDMMGGPSGGDAGPNPFAMFQQMAQQMGGTGGDPMSMFQQMHPQRKEQMRNEMNTQQNPTRDRLQKKLAEKNKLTDKNKGN